MRSGWPMAVGALILFLPTVATAASASAPILNVRIYDAFGVSSAELERARTVFEQTLDATDVQVRWRRCREAGVEPCTDRLQGNELVIRLIRGPLTQDQIPLRALGYSSLDTRHLRGTLATVFPDRIRTLAHRANWPPGDMLGHAIAHEVGHLILGSASHADDGLMRPHWTASHTQNSVANDWAFRDAEGADIRAAVRGRASRRRSTCRPPAWSRSRPQGASSPERSAASTRYPPFTSGL